MTQAETFLKNLQEKQSCCYLNFSKGQLSMWNFLADSMPVLNTYLLFKAAPRPHFDYLFPKTTLLGFQDSQSVSLTSDEPFRSMLGKIPASELQHAPLADEVLKIIKKLNLKTVLITTPALKSRTDFKAAHTVLLEDKNIFGNVEPVWRQLKRKLPSAFDAFVLALGEEKVLIGPRLMLSFNKPVFDLAVNTAPLLSSKHKVKAIVKKVLKKAFPNHW